MPRSLVYVSRAAFAPTVEDVTVESIVAHARTRNAALGITGALLFAQGRFAQNLEGPADAVASLMAAIHGDPRHRVVEIVYDEEIAARRFPTWTMAYSGPSTFIAGNILPLTDPLDPAAKRKAAERLIELMQQFAEARRIADRRHGDNSQIPPQ